MPLPVINFPAPQAPDLSNLGNLFGNVQKGFEASQAPKKAAEEYLQRILQNQLLRMQTRQTEQDVGLMDMALGRLGMGTQSQGMGGQIQPGSGMPMQGGMSNAPMQGGVSGGQSFAGQNQGMFANGIPQSTVLDAILTKRLTGGTDTFDDKVQVLPSGEVLFWNPKTGKMDVRQLGKSLAEIEAEKTSATELAKHNAQYINELEDQLSSEISKQPLFEELRQAVNTQEFLYGTGSVSSKLSMFTGNRRVNEVLSVIDSGLGELINTSFKTFKNQNQSEYKAMQRIKGSTSDNPWALKAKIDLHQALSQYRTNITRATLENLENNMSRRDAEQQAHKDVSYADVREIIKADDIAYQAARKLNTSYSTIMAAASRVQQETGESLYEIIQRLQK